MIFSLKGSLGKLAFSCKLVYSLRAFKMYCFNKINLAMTWRFCCVTNTYTQLKFNTKSV